MLFNERSHMLSPRRFRHLADLTAVAMDGIVRLVKPVGPVFVRGPIVRGYQRGRELGWPTGDLFSR